MTESDYVRRKHKLETRKRAVKSLPVGTVIHLRSKADGWHGRLDGRGMTVEAYGPHMIGVVNCLVTRWILQVERESPHRTPFED